MRIISKQRFNAFAAYCKTPLTVLIGDELQWYEADNSRILAAIIRDKPDKEYTGIILARDEKQRYRWISSTAFFKTKILARSALRHKISEIIPNLERLRTQGDNDKKPVDFFTPLEKTKQPLNQSFLSLTELEGYSPAKAIIEPMMRWHEDADGNFVEQFQTTGFDSRIWELYLFSLFSEAGHAIDKTKAVPDFCCTGLAGDFCVEATTVNPSKDKKGNIVPPPEIESEDQFRAALRDYFPIKFAGPLTEKLRKRYWQLQNVQGKPFVLAIQDFHTPAAMTLTRDALPAYLYGVRPLETPTPGNFIERIENHQWGNKIVKSNFFGLDDAENISAVIFNSSATISKFNRIGLQAGFGSNRTKILRYGTAYKKRNEMQSIEHYSYYVSESSATEQWVEGLDVFHNPRATHPLPMHALLGASHHYLKENGEIESWLPEWHPIQSFIRIEVG